MLFLILRLSEILEYAGKPVKSGNKKADSGNRYLLFYMIFSLFLVENGVFQQMFFNVFSLSTFF